jgi:hypothetical protein
MKRKNIFSENPSGLKEDLLASYLRLEALRSLSRFHNRTLETLKFEKRSSIRSAVTFCVFSSFSSSPDFVIPSIKRKYSAYNSHTQKHRQSDGIILNRILFLDNHQAFESFVSSCLTALFFLFPRFVAEGQESVPTAVAAISDLIESKSLTELKKLVAERKARGMVQSLSLMDLIQRFSKRFGFEFSLSVDELNSLARCVAARNILIHNDGLINDAYRNLMKKYHLSIEQRIGDRFIVSDRYLRESRKALDEMANRISKALDENATQIAAYHANKS